MRVRRHALRSDVSDTTTCPPKELRCELPLKNGLPLDARFQTPTSLAVDDSGNVFVADTHSGTGRFTLRRLQ